MEITVKSLINFNMQDTVSIEVKHAYEKIDHEAVYKEQLDYIAECVLLNANPKLLFDTIEPVRSHIHAVKWTKKEIVAGSAVANLFNRYIYSNDVDVYFKCIKDAMQFAQLNGASQQVRWNLAGQKDQLNVCAWVTINGRKYNLIWGIKHEDAEDLISGFDIRACAMAYDPSSEKIHMVAGALKDVLYKHIVWQPTAKALSVNRLIKYVSKDFSISRFQRVMFVELLKTKYNVNLELTTGYGDNE